MRLDDEEQSSNFERQGPGGGGLGGFGGGGGMIGMLLPLIGSKFGCTGIVIALAVLAFLNFGGGLMTGGAPVAPTEQSQSGAPAGAGAGAGEMTEAEIFSSRVLRTTERVWEEVFREHGQQYQPTVLSSYSREGRSGCGVAQSAMGPFYCPLDKKIYLDTEFFTELRQRFGAPGDFAQAYVIAHEVGHHIQNLEGTLGRVNQEQRSLGEAQANALQVKVELQADCYAGVWGKRTGRMEPGDLEEGMRAAEAIGDDTLQRQAGQRPMPDSFTHGSSEQRMAWLRRGLQSGDPASCDTFAASR